MDYTNILERINTSSWTAQQEQILLEPYTYHSQIPGKEIRSKLIEAFNLWLNVPEDDLEVIKRIVRMLHNASLLMDDVEDSSDLRRGIPVAHKIYGVPQTINSANYVYFLAMQELYRFRAGRVGKANAGSSLNGKAEEVGHGEKGKGKERQRTEEMPEEDQEKELDEVITEELLQLHRGQGLDLFWRDTLTCPTEEEYVGMVLGKTGGLFRIAVKLMMARSESSVDYTPLVNLISLLFQIRDDYQNLQSTEYGENKGFCEDLTEGKFSFPLIHGVRSERDVGKREILNVLQKRTTDRSLKAYTVKIMTERTKSFEYTRKVLRELEGQVYAEIGRLGGNRVLEGIVKGLSLGEEKEE